MNDEIYLRKNTEADALTYGSTIMSLSQKDCVDLKRYGGHSLYGNETEFSKIAIPDINWKEGDALVCIGPVKPT